MGKIEYYRTLPVGEEESLFLGKIETKEGAVWQVDEMNDVVGKSIGRCQWRRRAIVVGGSWYDYGEVGGRADGVRVGGGAVACGSWFVARSLRFSRDDALR